MWQCTLTTALRLEFFVCAELIGSRKGVVYKLKYLKHFFSVYDSVREVLAKLLLGTIQKFWKKFFQRAISLFVTI